MPKKKYEVLGWKCESCGHEWEPRKIRDHTTCPECNHVEVIR